MININLENFLAENQQKIAIDFKKEKCKIQILNSKLENEFLYAAQLIQQGKLVAFHTETVYGLGADALNPEAVKKIFYSKRRPFSDPVIVHISSIPEAKELVQFQCEETEKIFDSLAAQFWPGPLTFILPANFTKLDRILTAQTDFVGIRMPRSQIAQNLIKISGRPIAAPSANLFSHVSPTSSVHVFNDFFDQEIALLDGENSDYGVESTVIKIVAQEKSIQLLRLGSISEKQVREIVAQKFPDYNIFKLQKKVTQQQNHNENQEAPGQLLKHYSPNIRSFLLQVKNGIEEDIQQELKEQIKNKEIQVEDVNIEECVILDFNGKCQALKGKALNYSEMSQKDDMREVMKKLYDLLRWAENVPNAKNILIYDVKSLYDFNLEVPEFLDTVFDKIFRSTEGKRIYFDLQKQNFSM